MTEVIKYDLEVPVSVRKHTVDTEGLRNLLRNAKRSSGLTNRNIAESLSRPITEVEHWFRTDACFSIPDADVWHELKALLGIETDEYDAPITEFIEKPGVFEKAGRFYDINGIAPTLTVASADEKIIIDTWEDDNMSEQFNVVSTERETVTKPFTYASAFAGIGGMTLGLKPLGGEGVIAWEYDPTEKRRQYAQDAHKLLHPEIPVHGDICEADTANMPDFDLLCFTPPCQAFSVAGKRGGFEDTRGTLTFEALRIAKDKRPKALFMENVKGLVNHDKGDTMSTIIHAINEIGYTVDFTVLNSKYFDVAQNRERVYLIAVRDDLITPEPWKDVKGTTMLPKAKRRYQEEGARTFNFDWPEQTEVRTRLRDFLEDSVDEKYYLSDDKTAALVAQLEQANGAEDVKLKGMGRLAGLRNRDDRVFAYQGDAKRSTAQECIYLKDGALADSVTVAHAPKYIEGLPIKDATTKGYAVAAEGDAVAAEGDAVNIQFPNSQTRRGRVGKQMANTIEASGINQGVVEKDSRPIADFFIENSFRQEANGNGFRFSPHVKENASVAKTVTTRAGGRMDDNYILEGLRSDQEQFTFDSKNEELRELVSGESPIMLGHIDLKGHDAIKRVYSPTGQGPTLTTMGGGHREPKIAEEGPRYRIRKLTPRECLRLQSVPEDVIDKLQAEFSDSRLYKFAGNGLTTNVIKAIGERLLTYL